MSAWGDAGFPFGFRFRNPRDLVIDICRAMSERSLNKDSNRVYGGGVDDLPNGRPETAAIGEPPRRLDQKDHWVWSCYNGLEEFVPFIASSLLQIASWYCDPDKAHDFENYPDLENWTAESLEEKLKEKYVKFSPFCDREKYLLSIYHILNLCTVRRVALLDDTGAGKTRETYRSSYSIDAAKEMLSEQDFYLTKEWGQWFSISRAGNTYHAAQSKVRFITWIDEKRPCDTTFYYFASDSGVTDFYNFGLDYIQRNKWFCAGTPKFTEVVDNQTRFVCELDVSDSLFPPVPALGSGEKRIFGFSYDNYGLHNYYGYAVRDQRNYLKYVDNKEQS